MWRLYIHQHGVGVILCFAKSSFFSQTPASLMNLLVFIHVPLQEEGMLLQCFSMPPLPHEIGEAWPHLGVLKLVGGGAWMQQVSRGVLLVPHHTPSLGCEAYHHLKSREVFDSHPYS